MAGVVEKLLGYKGQVKIGDLTVDASISEVHSVEAEIADHPVEVGSDISDHYRPKNRPVQITGIVSNTPLAVTYPGGSLVNSVKSLANGDPDPAKAAWKTLLSYVDSAVIISIPTSLETYPDVMITSLRVTRDSKKAQALHFECQARQLRLVELEVADAIELPKKPKNPKTKTVESKNNSGRKPPKEVAPEKTKSMAAKLVDKGAGFFK